MSETEWMWPFSSGVAEMLPVFSFLTVRFRALGPSGPMALLTLPAATGESLGMDRLLKSNTSKTRTQSLFRQGYMLYELIPNMLEHRLTPLIEVFAKAISQASEFNRLFALER